MEVFVRAASCGLSSLLSFGGKGFPAKGLLCGTKPAVSAGQEFSAGEPDGGAAGDDGPLRVACSVAVARPWRGGALSGGWTRRGGPGGAGGSRARGATAELGGRLGAGAGRWGAGAVFT